MKITLTNLSPAQLLLAAVLANTKGEKRAVTRELARRRKAA